MCGALVLCLPETAVVGTLGGKDTLAENGILSGWGPAQPGGPGAWLPPSGLGASLSGWHLGGGLREAGGHSGAGSA